MPKLLSPAARKSKSLAPANNGMLGQKLQLITNKRSGGDSANEIVRSEPDITPIIIPNVVQA